MENAQYTINSLKELNLKLASEITKLRKENAEIPELRKEKDLLMARIIELEQSAKESAENTKLRDAEINELRSRVSKLEQKDSQNDKETSIYKSYEDTNQSSVNDISTETENSNKVSGNASNSDVHQESSSQPEVGSSEDKEIDEFLDLKSKERVSSEIKQHNREKKLQRESAEDQSSNLISDTSISPEQNHVSEKCQEISITNPDDRQKNFSNRNIEHLSESKSTNYNDYISEEPDKIEPTNRQYIEQGLIKELLSSAPIVSSVSSEIKEYRTFQITTQSLVRLFHYAIRSRHEEILAWYYYSDNFENRIIEICRELRVTDKTARTQLYKEMLENLPGITSGNLRMKTLRAKKIRMLFGKNGVGIDKIKRVTYSIYAISSLTNIQIQNVIKKVTSVEPLRETVTKNDDQTKAKVSVSSNNILPENKIPSIDHASVSSIPPALKPITEKVLPEKQTHDHAYFRNKTLL
ncbi:24934_t:CDS:1 [Cetraspora pellucida]|uniref:24934_t:CDS:1 n=1 Tax=Cetraspora pellucida TaxID=1433469 RepID=A0A9N9EK22_9GLOM|nr:24934_t:CDS:1 [Cetraspora pellucida]